MYEPISATAKAVAAATAFYHIETHLRELPLRQTSLLCQYNVLQYGPCYRI